MTEPSSTSAARSTWTPARSSGGALAELVDQGIYHLVVDLEQVSFLDSSGIGVLMGVQRRLREHGGSLRLAAPSARVRRVLELTGVTTVLPICTTHEATPIEPLDPLTSSNVNVE